MLGELQGLYRNGRCTLLPDRGLVVKLDWSESDFILAVGGEARRETFNIVERLYSLSLKLVNRDSRGVQDIVKADSRRGTKHLTLIDSLALAAPSACNFSTVNRYRTAWANSRGRSSPPCSCLSSFNISWQIRLQL